MGLASLPDTTAKYLSVFVVLRSGANSTLLQICIIWEVSLDRKIRFKRIVLWNKGEHSRFVPCKINNSINVNTACCVAGYWKSCIVLVEVVCCVETFNNNGKALFYVFHCITAKTTGNKCHCCIYPLLILEILELAVSVPKIATIALS